MKNFLDQQKRSRARLADAVRGYTHLRAGVGEYTDTIRTHDREGRPVVVLLRLDILPDET